MGNIRILPQLIVNQIAAGEVIERPAYAVKELVENALDAGASHICIDIIDSGLTRIRVTDNGQGMDQDDLLLSFQPHATSKLIDESLTRIKTMGFRGEALASIASISRLTLQSRIADTIAGNQVVVNQGKLIDTNQVGMPIGTSIESEGLFSPVPARKRFLKSLQTEFRHIVDIVTSLALAHPNVRFELNHNTRPYLSVSAGNQEERLSELLGETARQQFIPVKEAESYLTLTGFIGKPSLTAASSHKIWLSVNKRPVVDKLITLALKEAYASLLDPHMFPVAILELTLPPEVIDVNVHPRKQEIRFIDSRFVFDFVKQTVLQTLTANNLTFGKNTWQSASTSTPMAKELKQEVLAANPLAKTQLTQNNQILQVHNSYLVVQTSEGLLLIDQHAAHERVLYEQFKQAYTAKLAKKTCIPVNIPVEVGFSEALILDEHHVKLESLGLMCKKESATTYTITSIPQLFAENDAKTLLKEILSHLETEMPLKTIDLHSEDLIHFLACKGAIKAGDPLTQAQMHELFTELSSCKLPYTCPHGRPTHVLLGLDELKKLFKRS